MAGAVLLLWIVLYVGFDPKTHWGSFFGNAIADWSGLFVTVVATKYLYEIGSAESRKPPRKFLPPIGGVLERHSLTLFLLATGVIWVILFARSDPNSRWGQVVGNIVSEWTQTLGLLLMTKKLIERHSKESRE